MTAVVTAPVEWGVRHHGHPTGVAVDVRAGEDDARHWHHALLFCGNRDAQVVARAGADAAWISMGGVS